MTDGHRLQWELLPRASSSVVLWSSGEAQPPPAIQKTTVFPGQCLRHYAQSHAALSRSNILHRGRQRVCRLHKLPGTCHKRVSDPIVQHLNDASFAGILLHENATAYVPHKSVVRLHVWPWQMAFSGVLAQCLPNLLPVGCLTYVVFLEQQCADLAVRRCKVSATGLSNLYGQRFAIVA